MLQADHAGFLACVAAAGFGAAAFGWWIRDVTAFPKGHCWLFLAEKYAGPPACLKADAGLDLLRRLLHGDSGDQVVKDSQATAFGNNATEQAEAADQETRSVQRHNTAAASQPESHDQAQGDENNGDDDSIDIPAAFQDPINFGLMHDPVVLVGTGAIYDRQSITSWALMGYWRCPKTNIELSDLEIVPLPALREHIRQWAQENKLDVEEVGSNLLSREEALKLDPDLPNHLSQLRSGSLKDRGRAAADLNNLLISWGKPLEGMFCDAKTLELRNLAFVEAMDGLTWLVRHGNTYGAGVAASALSQADSVLQEHDYLLARQHIGAFAAAPASKLLSSSDRYAAHSAARLLALTRDVAPKGLIRRIVESRAVERLLEQLEPWVTYARCSAAQALAVLLADEKAVKQLQSRIGGVALLAYQVASAADDQGDKKSRRFARYAARDAADALLVSGIPEAEIKKQLCAFAGTISCPNIPKGFDTATMLSEDSLIKVRDCSNAWLGLEVDHPWERKEEDTSDEEYEQEEEESSSEDDWEEQVEDEESDDDADRDRAVQ